MSLRRPPTLLIVDDDRALRRMLGWSFEDLGYWVWTAGDGQEAIASAAALAFDYALLDYHLPDGTGGRLGHALTRQIPALQILIMSADADVVRTGSIPVVAEKPLRVERIHRWFSALDQGRPRPAAAVGP